MTGSQLSPIAIVGIGGVFPGARDLPSFWANVVAGVDASREPPPGRWVLPVSAAFDPEKGRADKVYSRRACFVDEFDLDLTGLDIDQSYAEALDPMVRLALQAGGAAWRDGVTAGIDRKRVGVILGNIALPTDSTSQLADWIVGRGYVNELFAQAGSTPPPEHRRPTADINRYVTGLPAGVLARALGLGALHFTLDAACASSLFALKHAVDELTSGRADAMLTGGLSRPDSLYTQMGFSQLFALSQRGRCAPFDHAADGLVVGEGAGIFVLKRLADAVAAGDHVYAVVRGVGLSNDVDGNLLAPSAEGQLRAMRAAYRQAGWAPQDVDLIECHATGTAVGDAVEFASLRELWGEPERDGAFWRRGQCTIGSVKSNVGHLLTGAGAAGLVKVLFAMGEGVLPPTANFASPNAEIDLAEGPFRVGKESAPWPRRDDRVPRRAAVSGFGFGGTNAHLLLEEYLGQDFATPAATTAAPPHDDVVIVGMGASCGPWSDLPSFQHRVLGNAMPVPPTPKTNFCGQADPPVGWFQEHVAIATGRFRIPPTEIAETLPQQLRMLDVAQSALADAARSSAGESDRLRTGVFIGIGLDLNTTNYHLRWALRARAVEYGERLGQATSGAEFEAWVTEICDGLSPALNANRVMGNLGGIVASRVAREFGIGGPSYVLSTEEGSGLAALEAAVRALQLGEIESALVGAVDLTADVRATVATDAGRPFSRGDAVRPFDRGADGTLLGEGAAAVLLKRRRDALRDGNRIYAAVRGVGSATGGGAADLVPSVAAYSDALVRAFADAGVKPSTVGFVECHGSGFATENRVEATALRGFFTAGATTLGSAKADVGHTGAAAGLVSLVKAALCLHHRILPPLRGTRRPLPAIDGFAVPKEPRYWLRDADAGPRRAGVSSMSVTGACHHVVLEAVDTELSDPQPLGPRDEFLFAIEAADTIELDAALAELAERVDTIAADGVSRLAWEWHRDRGTRSEARLAVALVCRDAVSLRELIGTAREGVATGADMTTRSRRRVFYTAEPLGPSGEVAFVYPGSGSQYPGMGREIGVQWPAALRRQETQCSRLESQLGEVLPDEPRRLILAQVGLGTLVSDVVRSFGVEPQAVIGYSLGETAGLFSLGAWHDRDEMLRRVAASDLFRDQLTGACHAARRTWGIPDDEPVDWALGVVDCPAPVVRDALAGLPRAYLLIVNTPDECVIGGARAEVEAAVATLGVRFHELHGVTTVHCEVARAVEESYRELHVLETDTRVPVRFYSGEAGCAFELTKDNAADSVLNQALRGVDYPRVIEQAYADGVRTFLEMGPGSSCTRMITKILDGRPFAARAVCAQGQDGTSAVLRALALLVAHRVPVDLSSLYPEPCIESPESASVVVPVGSTKPVPPAPAQPEPVLFSGPAAQLERVNAAVAAAHDSYLRLSREVTALATQQVEAQTRLLEELRAKGPASWKPVLFDREQCLQIAVGSIGDVLGPEFAVVDSHPTRVRLPDEPLMLVDRILSIEGAQRSMTSGKIVTEHDVLPDKWYLDNGRIPTCIAVEAGQADLFLSGYLGIDFVTKGLAVYRLLDAVVTFHDDLPGVGATIHYEIQIKHFFRQGDTWLFRFEFEASVDGRPLLTMREGCAGFFTPAELETGKGIVHNRIQQQARAGAKPTVALVPMTPCSLDASQVLALRRGDLAAAFGEDFAGLGLRDPLTLPTGNLELVHRVTKIDPNGGSSGIGGITAEADIHPDDWFLTSHFVDDKVMPGTLMYECCLHTLRIYLLRMGWVADASDVVYQPIVGVRSRLKCRGQVLDTTQVVTYEVSIKELGYEPEPFAIVDSLMYADGKPIVEISDMSVRLSGVTATQLVDLWSRRAGAPARASANRAEPRRVLYDYDRILAFSNGNPSEAFGAPYAVFDRERVIARLPRPPFQFLDRIVDVTGAPFEMVAGASCVAEVDVTAEQWYFASNRQDEIPFAVLLEMALQPCGWLAAYVGSALQADEDLKFRNLGGDSVQRAPVHAGDDTLTTAVELTNVSRSGGMIIQHYRFSMTNRNGEVVYEGTTYFGFFSLAALADQVGIRDARFYVPTASEAAGGRSFEVPRIEPFADDQFRMIDQVDVYLSGGGPAGKGFIEGSIDVDPSRWFFAAHFYQDPVWPGSLGLEAFLQLLKVVAVEHWKLGAETRFTTTAIDARHRWVYRGQILPTAGRVTVQVWITDVDESRRRVCADGFLSVDGRPIYSMHDFSLESRLSPPFVTP